VHSKLSSGTSKAASTVYTAPTGLESTGFDVTLSQIESNGSDIETSNPRTLSEDATTVSMDSKVHYTFIETSLRCNGYQWRRSVVK